VGGQHHQYSYTPADCVQTGSGTWRGQDGSLPSGRPHTYTGELGWKSAANLTTTMNFEVLLTVDAPQSTPGGGTFGPTTNIRCDSKSYFRPTKGGCAYPAYTANVLVLSAKDADIIQAAKIIKSARNEIRSHVGKPGFAHLTRLANPSGIRKNRRASCGKVHPTKSQSCDEYPFASTHQGAAFAAPGDWRAKAINAKQNSKVGTMLGRFFLANRILDGDPFFVRIIS
jgi:deoxyribonuclease NucA/NucB